MVIEDLLQRKFVDFDGNQFQSLFFEIMKLSYLDDFFMPRVYGPCGDYKCDGCIKSTGTFFACYGPENPADYNKADAINSKLYTDIVGLQKKIDDGTWKIPLNEFIFVLNLKLINVAPAPVQSKAIELEKELSEKYKRKIRVSIWTQYDLKLKFNSLSTKDKQFIINKAYFSEEDINFDGSIVASIIEHFSTATTNKSLPHNIMEFKKKLSFNHLSESRCADLESASYNISALETYLDELSSDSISILQSMISSLYKEAKERFPDDSNSQFDYVKEKIYPIEDEKSQVIIKAINETTLIIMSKFFENCSIFESEKK